MKKVYLILGILQLLITTTFAQSKTDTLFVMKLGDIAGQYHVKNEMDSLIFYKPQDPNSAQYIHRIRIYGGKFTMGSPDLETSRNTDEKQHQVNVSDFLISKFEITNEQYAEFLNKAGVGADGLYPAGKFPTQALLYPNSSNLFYDTSLSKWVSYSPTLPAVCVTWYGASEFASYYGGSLPTEAQWEYAARARTNTAFYCGDCLASSDAKYNWAYPYGSCIKTTNTIQSWVNNVGTYPLNPFSLADMAGNALEWCSDWYGDYASNEETNPTGATTGTRKVYRGGSWASPAKYCRSAWRGNQTPNFYHNSLGFRVAFPDTELPKSDGNLYVMKDGVPSATFNLQTSVDSLIFYRSKQESISRLPGILTTDPNISIFTQALYLTHLADSIRQTEDKSYRATQYFKDEYNSFQIITPSARKYGYTVFVENNDVLKSYGINSLNDLILKAKEWYPTDSKYDNDYSNKKNSLNQFIAYHLVNKAIYYNKFFYTRNTVKGYIPDEFIETMLENRVIRASLVNTNVTLNTNTDFSTIVPALSSKGYINGVSHKINKLLVYSPAVEQMLQNTRLRFDFASLLPELTNNNIRCSEGFMPINNSSGDRFGFQANYLKDISWSKDTRLLYLAGKNNQWNAYQADELMALGAYDLTVRLLPVPPGTYELRYGYNAYSKRSITQIYIDGIPVGIPIDLKIDGTDPRIGYINDNQTTDNGYENDKLMRNHGYMKAPNTIFSNNVLMRNSSSDLRFIIGTFTFTDYKAHTIRFQSVTSDNSKQLILDYFEYVPQSIYEPVSGEPEGRE